MEPRSRAYLHDIRTAADLVVRFTAGSSFAEFAADPLLRSAVERQLEIAGEALSQLAKTDPTTAAQVSDFRRIIALRNILIHGYAKVDHRVIWDIVEQHVPILRREVDALLTQSDRSAP
jgi:uncharacterized protein with HEPN domain